MALKTSRRSAKKCQKFRLCGVYIGGESGPATPQPCRKRPGCENEVRSRVREPIAAFGVRGTDKLYFEADWKCPRHCLRRSGIAMS